ncbi:hypothetical protein GOP47_0024659 [Adiantum capillus-veneris]|uniref:Phospholipase D n=1 Tax=Adiantum capillus-veneris TaxID=13818 RepID=A0A9D4U4G2_ADICA|nr:hypothetical protein GOP47_0024659 [Adiantum capillus-veneris]
MICCITQSLRLCTCNNVQVIEELEKATHIGSGVSKLYATVDIGAARVIRTRPVKYASSNPKWNQSFRVYCAYEAKDVTIEVKDELTVGTVVIAKRRLSPSQLLSLKAPEGWFNTFDPQDPRKQRGRIFIKLEFHEINSVPSWGQGIKGCDIPGVHYSFFKQENGNAITLYQDSHVRNEFRPQISLDQRRSYEPHRCWEDIYTALSGAKHLIYIAGWSVFSNITLVRDMERPIPRAQGVTLGEFLKGKAQEGVRVLLLLWDDRTSIPRVEITGVMHTHDEDTAAYFRGSKVHCVRCPRNPDNGSSIVQGLEVGLMFTHHQKTIVVDVATSAANTGQRKLVSFLGGIDLCDGRYDNQNHSLFGTLGTVHKEDFHQTNFEGASLKQGGPREPWHDVHARIEGPAAWDVHCNFEQRWRRQANKRHLLSLKTIPELWPPSEIIQDDNPESWNAQIFRSIDEGAVDGFPKKPDIAAQMGLVTGKENIIDRSIQDAYICAIRQAKHFIYMENQYFLGSSASWSSHQDAGAIQLIPMELTLKIISKIEAGERFAVYVVIPMWPEGVPESAAVQEILYWQRLTMEMMYKRIAAALKKNHIDGIAQPTDYLNFFCLGNREAPNPREYQPSETPKSEDYRNAQEHRRFMIYVHAKTMIVDDEYIIVGSANCNQRSMDGARDSEIAVGAYQPHHVMEGSLNARPQGQVYGFRMSLWYEHTGKVDKEFQNPESLACVRMVQKISQELWTVYTQPKITNMTAHFLPYPITVLPDGEVRSLPGYDNFPDTKASVLGAHSNTLPAILTV